MKRLITMLLIWQLFVNASEKSEEYVIFLTEDNGTIHKCKREDYNEMIELLNSNKINELDDMHYYYCFEKDTHNKMIEASKK